MNNYKTLSQLTQEVIRNLSMYQGTATQLYAEDRIAATIIQIFNELFDSRFWSLNTAWFEFNLAGIEGVCKENVAQKIANFHDIYSISTDINPDRPLRKLHATTNPYKISGTTPVYYMPSQNPEKIFSVVPFNATGKLYVQARVRPSKITADTIIPFDPDVLVYGACYEYCASDGNNQVEIQKFLTKYEQRLKTLESNENSGTFDYNDEVAYFNVNNWR